MSRNKKKSSNKRKLHKASKKVNRDRTSTTPNTGQTSTTPSTGQTSTTPNTGQTSTTSNTGQTSTTPNTGQTSTPKKVDILIVLRYSVPLFKGVSFILTIPKKLINTEMNQYEKSAAKNKTPDEEIIEVDRGQASTTPNTGQTSTPKKKTNQYEKSAAKNKPSDKEIVEVDRGQTSTTPNTGQTSIPKKKMNQYEKSAANRDELSDEVEIVEVARGQTSTTPATGQVYQKNYRDPFVLDISQVLMESRQKSKTSRDLEESYTDKEMAKSLAYRYNNSDYEKLKREHSRLRDEHAYLQGRMCEVYRELKEIKGELNELWQNYIKLHFHNKYINHENEVLRAEINNLKSQISSQDDADVESSESESNDNDNRPGKKKKVVRCQIDQSDDDSETDEENARTEMKPRFSPSYKQINDWLAALHKHRRARLLYVERGVIDKDNRRLHKNNRLSEKKSCKVKGAISLFKRNDDRVKDYDKTEVLNILKDTRYHSPEDSEMDKEQPDGKRKIIVYNLSWRFDELINFLQNVLDTHVFSLQMAQLTRGRNYDDESYCITSRHPKNAPEWAYKTQNTPVNTDFSGPDTPVENHESQSQTDDNTQTEHND
ncbi:unnamed protein product [Rhizophagus irregularis]|uniref:Uncharacterized protein n=1 Tax=Rhizophagus irregularis TaxID=588596 RepID=A0A915ZXC2_9GLOM|nr:unnamed protein product [Rhizophagus irregularis]